LFVLPIELNTINEPKQQTWALTEIEPCYIFNSIKNKINLVTLNVTGENKFRHETETIWV
jgi:hypothetical protein